MKPIQRYKFLQIFGDALPHSWFEVIFLGCQHLKMKQTLFEPRIFKQALADGLIRRQDNKETLLIKSQLEQHTTGVFLGADWKQYDYIITDKGDECLRNEQIKRDGDYSYYKNYDRTVHGKYGVDHFAPLSNGFHKA